MKWTQRACRQQGHDGIVAVLVVISAGFLLTTRASAALGSDYQWQTGEWSRCSQAGCGPGGTQMRNIWCAHKTGWQTLDVNCASEARPVDSRECFQVCDFHRFQFGWQVGNWSLCRPKPGNKDCDEVFGVQTRNVTCVAKCDDGHAPSDNVCTYFRTRPTQERTCRLMCPESCIVGPFGPWTECNSCWITTRTRYRDVLASPRNGGSHCFDRRESQDCIVAKYCYDHKDVYRRYRLGNWTDCMPFSGKDARRIRELTTAIGHRRRTVDCLDSRGKLIDKSLCDHITRPISVKLCIRQQNCLVSHWTHWTTFQRVSTSDGRMSMASPGGGVFMRQRNVLEVTRGHGENCPVLSEQRSVRQEDIKEKCEKYRWLSGEWEDCKPLLHSDTCGSGLQKRVVLCTRNEDQAPVTDDNCARRSPEYVRTCNIPCRQECLLSEWGPWSECLPKRCRLGRARIGAGYRMRSRLTLREGLHGGSTCPHQKETWPCSYEPCYRWNTTTVGDCRLKYDDMQCGQGFIARQSVCTNMHGTEVANTLCGDPRPASREVCRVPCPQDCVLSEWSDWSDCSRTCGLGRVAGFQQRKKEIIAIPGSDGAPCPPQRLLLEKRSCEEVPCFTYHWRTSAWEPCRTAGGKECGTGVQYRETVCHKSTGQKVGLKRCATAERPVSKRNCTVSCPSECVVSAFTDWSDCPVTCTSGNNLAMPNQVRRRFVLRPPTRQDRSCPTLAESRQCFAIPKCIAYHWKVSDWSVCVYADPVVTCGDGYRARDVVCLGNNDEILPKEFCISQLGQMPEVARACHVSCAVTMCSFSDWMEWGSCSERCGGVRKRFRAMEGNTDKIASCYDDVLYPLREQLQCACASFTPYPVGPWSQCILDKNGVDHRRLIGRLSVGADYCGIGKRQQAIVCSNTEVGNATASLCQSADFVEEMCFLPCPRDCELSEWSSWSPCHVTRRCGTGVRTRSRYVIESSLDGGRDCPPLDDGEEYQSAPCSRPCDHFRWTASEWSECTALVTISKVNGCGPGLQSRIVRCMKLVGIDWVETKESKCEAKTKPKVVNYCHAPCPGQCVVSSWSEWTGCQDGCDKPTKTQRYRTVLRRPALGSGVKCPHVVESELWDLGVNYFKVNWQWSEWGDCVLDPGVPCGKGQRKRHRQCLRTDGEPTSEENCRKSRLAREKETVPEELCDVPCPVDCALSQWTTWSDCSVTCGLGVMSRSRVVVIYPTHRGRQCPDELSQRKPCVYVECFRWQVSPWQECGIEEKACGYGTQRRNITCERHDGVAMEAGLCPEELRPQISMTRGCFLPCPGDCVLSDWSSWSPCHRPCTPQFTLPGVQTRSRAVLSDPLPERQPCPERLWESRACRGGYCPTYSWHTSYWFGARRAVWCQRSDGMAVIGGCDERTRPTEIKRCDPPCSAVPFSYCQDTNSCRCQNGYRPVTDDDGQLVECQFIVMVFNRSRGTDADNAALYIPKDGPSNIWMHAVIAAGSAFVIFVTVALYWVCKNSRKESRQATQTTSASNATTRLRSSLQDNETALMSKGNQEKEKDLHSTEIS